MKQHKQILDEAFEQLVRVTHLEGEIVPLPAEDLREPDALIRLFNNNDEWVFGAEVKTTITDAQLIALEKRIQTYPYDKTLLVTRYVNPNMADRLKERQMPFIDTVGNIFINDPRLFVFIKGNKPDKPIKNMAQGRPFKPTGLRVTFALLCQPELRQADYRTIEKATGVALGTVAGVITDLKKMGYLVEIKKGQRKLRKGEELLNKWTDAYLTQLRPKLIKGRYYGVPPDGGWINATGLTNLDGCIGGEVAATRITHYLKGETLTLYTDEPIGPFLLNIGLKKDPNGNVEILEKFWDFDYGAVEYGLAPTVLVYADLIGIGDARTLETAKLILEKDLIDLEE